MRRWFSWVWRRFTLRSFLLFVLLAESGYWLWTRRGPWVTARILDAEVDYLMMAAFSPDGRRIIAGNQDGSVFVWDAGTGAELCCVCAHPGVWGWDASFSPDGERIITEDWGEDWRLPTVWSARDGARLFGLIGHDGGIWYAEFSPDGSRIVTAGNDGTARLWDSKAGECLAVFEGHTEIVWYGTFSPDGKRIATANDDGTARVWDVETRAPLLKLEAHTDSVGGVFYSPDGTRLLTTAEDGTARVWCARTGACIAVLDWGSEYVNCAAWSPDGRSIATICEHDCTARLWHERDDGYDAVVPGREFLGWRVSFSPNGRRVLCSGGDFEAVVLDARTGGTRAFLGGRPHGVTNASYSPDGERIVTAGMDGKVRVWRLRRPEAWWGVAWLPEFWFTLAFAAALAWSLARDLRRSPRA